MVDVKYQLVYAQSSMKYRDIAEVTGKIYITF